MREIRFERKERRKSLGVRVRIQGIGARFIRIPDSVRCCYDREAAVVMFLETIAQEVRAFAKSSAVRITGREIFFAIWSYMSVITAVYYESCGSVFCVARGEGA